MLSKGSPVNPGELAISSEDCAKVSRIRSETGPVGQEGVPTGANVPSPKSAVAKGNQRRQRRIAEQSYEPIVPVKVGNPRAPARGGQGIHWREGGNRWTQ